MNDYMHCLMWNAVTHSCPNSNTGLVYEVIPCMSNYSPLFYADVINYDRPSPDARLANLC